MHALLIGAGVVGVSSAWALQRRGVQVTLLEAGDEVACGASHANGGQLSWSFTDPLASPAILRQLPRLMLGGDPAFRLHLAAGLRADPAFAVWLLRFLRHCTPARERANLLAILRLGLHSRRVLQGWQAALDLPFDYRQSGKLRLFSSAEGLARAAARSRLKAQLGVREECLDAAACRRLDPALDDWRGAAGEAGNIGAGGIWAPEEAVGDARAFTAQLAARCRAAGARIETGAAVVAIEQGGGRPRARCADGREFAADALAICAGPQAASLLRRAAAGMGRRLPIQPMQGYSLTLPALPGAPRVGLTDSDNKVVFCRLGERLRIAGVAELGRDDAGSGPDAARIDVLLRTAAARLPAAADFAAAQNDDSQGEHRQLASWAGVRPVTPHGRPLIEHLGGGVWVNAGHGMLGWTLAAGAADLLAAQLCGEPAPLPAADYAIRSC